MNANVSVSAGESVNDILENIPSDSERLAATDGGGRRRYRFRRPAPFDIFRRRTRSEERRRHDIDDEQVSMASIDSSSVRGGTQQTA